MQPDLSKDSKVELSQYERFDMHEGIRDNAANRFSKVHMNPVSNSAHLLQIKESDHSIPTSQLRNH